MKLSDRSKTVVIVISVFFFIVMLLALAEGATRVRQWVKYGSFGHLDAVYKTDPVTNLRVPESNTKTGTIQINSLGFRGPELADPKDAKSVRIAFLGASTTFCAEVSSNELAWPHLVSQYLQQAYQDLPIEYVNGAVPGYTVTSSLRNLRERITPLKPDVIVVYHATNDLSVETRKLATQQAIIREGDIEKTSWLADYSLLWYLVEKNLRLIKLQEEAKAQQGRLRFNPDELGSEFEKNLRELVHAAQEVANVVVLVTFSHQVRAAQSAEQQLKASTSALYYMPFMTPTGLIDSFSRYNSIIRDVAKESGVLLVDGEMAIPGDSEHFNDTVHFKDKGSQAMAKRVSKALLVDPSFKALMESKAMSHD